MVSIKKLEKLIKPYESDWGISDEFGNEFRCYEKGDTTSRIDSAEWFLRINPRPIYKKELIRVATELGLMIEDN
jgi:hypothetical protein